MNTESMKNMVVLKNLPSNIVEEAIVILKPNIKLKSLDKIEKNSMKNKNEKSQNSKKYIINEAEMLIANYISKIESDRNKKINANKKIENKYKRLKIISVFLCIAFLTSIFAR